MATTTVPSGFDAIGHPIPQDRRQSAYDAIRHDMAPEADAEEAMSLVNRVADRLERDQPYEAMKETTEAPIGPRPPLGHVDMDEGVMAAVDAEDRVPYKPMGGLVLDYTGGIRLFAHLLTAPVDGESE